MRPLAIFLDDGGVISDNHVRGEQWRALVAKYFAPILGGEHEAWEHANWQTITAILEHNPWQHRLQATPDYDAFERAYFTHWLDSMCRIVGVPVPSHERSIELGRAATAWIIPQIHASYPGAAEAIRTLHSQGYSLYTASGESSSDLRGYFAGIGVLDCFQRLYGPDLVQTFKARPDFYTHILADAGIDPSDALALDNNPHAAAWASQAGVRCILVGAHQTEKPPDLPASIPALADLPALLTSTDWQDIWAEPIGANQKL